jgi:hypothetical protein
MQIVEANGYLGLLLPTAERRKNKAGEDGDDGDNNQEFNQSERPGPSLGGFPHMVASEENLVLGMGKVKCRGARRLTASTEDSNPALIVQTRSGINASTRIEKCILRKG